MLDMVLRVSNKLYQEVSLPKKEKNIFISTRTIPIKDEIFDQKMEISFFSKLCWEFCGLKCCFCSQ
ncbi:hypothetical protein C943_04244 [Mariniradius saccharolyticus AK6]|uniref:Uncharacterized protein n=1 Tax=Mariniradius saccharolyticus AK6 TaxID=1239962 RepID=M7X963_9BACT|nr:hypothetical protein C943_04244 [Mariniradius saccharolyticus AK6]